MGTESDPVREQEWHAYSFFHLLLQEFTAAKYVATLDKVSFKRGLHIYKKINPAFIFCNTKFSHQSACQLV